MTDEALSLFRRACMKRLPVCRDTSNITDSWLELIWGSLRVCSFDISSAYGVMLDILSQATGASTHRYGQTARSNLSLDTLDHIWHSSISRPSKPNPHDGRCYRSPSVEQTHVEHCKTG